MAEEEDGVRMTIRAEIVVNPRRMRDTLPEFCIDFFDEVLDLRALAAEVLADYPEPVAVDVDTIARFAVKHYYGKYIRVADYPAGTPREIVQELVWRISRWMNWPRRHAQLQGAQGSFPRRIFTCDVDACSAALALRDHTVDAKDSLRLPLKGCWGQQCHCDYRLVRRDGNVI